MDCHALKGSRNDKTFNILCKETTSTCEGVLATVAVHLSLQNTEAVMYCCACAHNGEILAAAMLRL